MTDVKVLIAALTTERNAIDRAITGLKAMSEMRATPSASAPKVKTARTRAPKTRMRFSEDTKAEIVARMAVASNQSVTARILAHQFGVSFNTIQSGWKRWQKQLNNGAQPTTSESAIGVQ